MSTPSEFAALLRADPESGFSPPKQSKKLIMPPQFPEKGNMHVRTKSDMSLSSAVMDLTKSALIKEVTEEGRILVSFNVV